VWVGGGLVVGHLLGGAQQEDRTVLALSTSGRHPAVAVAVGAAAAPELRSVIAAVLLYLVVSMVAAQLYARWSRRGRAVPSKVGIGAAPIPKLP